jgi:protein-S-isoprenylcysteine O-methyltransferase Ste14
MWGLLYRPTSMVIAVAWACFVLYWIISAPVTTQKEKLKNLVLSLVLLAAVACVFMLLRSGNIPDGVNPVLWKGTLPVALCADVVVALGLFLLVWARRTLGPNWSSTVGKTGDSELVTRGPYAYVRHPIYTGFIVLVLGTVAAYGRLIGVPILVACCVGLYIKASKEEALLKKKFPGAFEEYRARTRMLIPFVF